MPRAGAVRPRSARSSARGSAIASSPASTARATAGSSAISARTGAPDHVLDVVPAERPARLDHQHDARRPDRRASDPAQGEVAGPDHQQRLRGDRRRPATPGAAASSTPQSTTTGRGSAASSPAERLHAARAGRAAPARGAAATPPADVELEPGQAVGGHAGAGRGPPAQPRIAGIGHAERGRHVAGQVGQQRARAADERARTSARADATTVVPAPPLTDQQEISTRPPQDTRRRAEPRTRGSGPARIARRDRPQGPSATCHAVDTTRRPTVDACDRRRCAVRQAEQHHAMTAGSAKPDRVARNERPSSNQHGARARIQHGRLLRPRQDGHREGVDGRVRQAAVPGRPGLAVAAAARPLRAARLPVPRARTRSAWPRCASRCCGSPRGGTRPTWRRSCARPSTR